MAEESGILLERIDDLGGHGGQAVEVWVGRLKSREMEEDDERDRSCSR